MLIRSTRIGDLNLDGAVTISDFIDLASNFNGTNKTWQEGDLNYDGKADFNDEIEGWRAAFESMSKYEFMNTGQVFVVGLSNGGGFSPHRLAAWLCCAR